MSEFSVAVVQNSPTSGDVPNNRRRCVELIRDKCRGTDLVVLPELCITGYDLDLIAVRGPQLAETVKGPSTMAFAEVACELGTTIAYGLLEHGSDGLYDTTVFVRPDCTVHAYRKTHLYPTEVSLFKPGTDLRIFTVAGLAVAPMICFEHAFPDVATTLATAGAQLLVIPSAVPFGYEHLLRLRTRARAQDNQIFSVAANLAGSGFCGGSLIADPRGEVLAETHTAESVLRAELNLSAITEERAREPSLGLRQPQLYTSPVLTESAEDYEVQS